MTQQIYETLVSLDVDLVAGFCALCFTGDESLAKRFSLGLDPCLPAKRGEVIVSRGSTLDIHSFLTYMEAARSWELEHVREALMDDDVFGEQIGAFTPAGHMVVYDETFHSGPFAGGKPTIVVFVHEQYWSRLLREERGSSCEHRNDNLISSAGIARWGSMVDALISYIKTGEPVNAINEQCEPRTRLFVLLDPRLPGDFWRRFRDEVTPNFFRRRTLEEIWSKGDVEEGTEFAILEVDVVDEIALLQQVPAERRETTARAWRKVREEVLRKRLSVSPWLRPLYVAFCEHAKLEIIEKRVRDADLLCSQGKYDAAVALCRQVAETLFKLMTGEPEEAPVDSKRIWNRKDDISGTYGERVFYDLANVWKDGSKLVHRPEANEAEMRYKARDIVGRTAHLWNMFKQRHFEYYGLPVTWQE